MPQKGKLILFPVGIGNDDLSVSLPAYNASLLDSCTAFIVEELRTARRFLKKAGYTRSIDETNFYLLNEHTQDTEISTYLDAIDEGENVGLLSEAGLPCIADPGAKIVKMAQHKGIEVQPLVGPSSLMLALMASGFNGQNFAFNGYLPIDKGERVRAIKNLEMKIFKENQTQLFIEAPYRNNQMLETLATVCSPNTMICVACDISLETQFIKTKTAKQWKNNPPNLHKRNTVFVMYK
ncbi:MAG: SAM-dependent methyltransferase [Bacteroidales bacterium]|nr:SAM-dependent methyltransferase [Bacteroidales bacterium]